MNLLEEIIKCNSDEEIDELITEAIKEADKNSEKIEQLGFLDSSRSINLFKGFIPLDTRIKYMNLSMEDYGMQTTDYFYEFAHYVKKYDINNKGALINFLEYYINNYFGFPGKMDRREIFNTKAWQTTTTDEEYFAALENNKIGDLKGMGAAECTERSALAQQILSLFGMETYYCIGNVDFKTIHGCHCFNAVKTKNGYTILDYSLPVTSYTIDGKVRAYYPFIGVLSNEEFEQFINQESPEMLENYEYVDGERKLLSDTRIYTIGKLLSNEKKSGMKI